MADPLMPHPSGAPTKSLLPPAPDDGPVQEQRGAAQSDQSENRSSTPAQSENRSSTPAPPAVLANGAAESLGAGNRDSGPMEARTEKRSETLMGVAPQANLPTGAPRSFHPITVTSRPPPASGGGEAPKLESGKTLPREGNPRGPSNSPLDSPLDSKDASSGAASSFGFGTLLVAPVRLAGVRLPFWVPLGTLGLALVFVVRLTLSRTVVLHAPSSAVNPAAFAPAVPPAASALAPPAVSPLIVSSASPTASARVVEAKLAESGQAEPSSSAKPSDSAGRPDELAEILKQADVRWEQERMLAQQLRKRIEGTPDLIKEGAVVADLRRQIDNPSMTREALGAIAAGAGPNGPDMLYEIALHPATRADAVRLAHDLLRATEVRAKMSPALSVVVALEDAETCEQLEGLIPRALGEGDRRASPLLLKLEKRRGCGPKKTQDCYPCLRHGQELQAAINAVRGRR